MPDAAAVVTLAVLARDVDGDDIADRRRALVDAVGRAPAAELLVLPYLAAHPPFWRDLDRGAGFRHAERFPYPSLLGVQHAAEARRTALLATVYEALGEGVFYALAQVSGPHGEVLRSYRQWHAVNQPGLHERLYLQPGSEGEHEPPLFDRAGLRLGILMGGDLWAPEMGRLLRLAGAEAMIALTAVPAGRPDEIRTLSAARALENGVPVVLANRGDTPELFGAGASLPDGQHDGDWRIVELRPDAIRRALCRDDPLMVRRPRLYAPLVQRWEDGQP